MAQLPTLLGIVAALLVLSVLASKAAVRFGVPTLLLFLALGIAAGSEGFGGIWFDYPRFAQGTGIVALIYILFAAGLETKAADFRQQMWPAISLATIGVFVSCALVAIFSHYAMGFGWAEGFLLGAVVSCTDAAAVFSVLRAKETSFSPNLLHIIEAESGCNDPMAVFLTFAAIGAILKPNTSLATHIWHFAVEMGVGALIGYFGGKMIAATINRIRLQWEGLYPVLSVALVLLLFAVCSLLKGNGFLAVYAAGLVVGNTTLIHRRSLLLFHDGIAWLLQIAMFLILGLQVFPSQLLSVAKIGLYVSVFLIFIARPLSVIVGLAPFRLAMRERLFVAWAGLRGAAPIILAIFAVTSRVHYGMTIFNTVFFVALLSVALQGTTINTAGRWLRVRDPNPAPRRFPLRYDPASLPNREVVEFEVQPNSIADESRVVDLALPRGVLILLVARGGEHVIPDGGAVLHRGDVVQLVADVALVSQIQQVFEGGTRQRWSR